MVLCYMNNLEHFLTRISHTASTSLKSRPTIISISLRSLQTSLKKTLGKQPYLDLGAVSRTSLRQKLGPSSLPTNTLCGVVTVLVADC